MNLRHDLARPLRGIADTIDRPQPFTVLAEPCELEAFMDAALAEMRHQLSEIARSN